MGYCCENPRYPLDQKESVLEALASNDTGKTHKFLGREVEYIDGGLTMPDFLEILPGATLIECMKVFGNISDQNSILGQNNHNVDEYVKAVNERFDRYLTTLRQLVENPNNHKQVNAFFYARRKCLGMCGSFDRIKELSEIVQYADGEGMLNREDVLVVHYPGSFHPFPHKGHLEVAELVHSQAGQSDMTQPCRIVVSTNAINPNRPALSPTFHDRLDNLRRGFFNEDYSSVLGIAGDFADKHHRMSQLLLIAQFEREKRLRLVLGSDNFLNTFRQATDGVDYYRLLLNSDNQIFVSLRKGDDYESVTRVISQARQTFQTDIVPLSPQNEAVTGTFIRSQPAHNRRQYVSNDYVRLDI